MLECTAASGQHDHATFWERADESVRCSGFWAKLLLADRPTGLGPGDQMTGSCNAFLCYASVFDVATYATSGAFGEHYGLTRIYGPTGHAIGWTAQQALRSFYYR
jgi:hypothetical protein